MTTTTETTTPTPLRGAIHPLGLSGLDDDAELYGLFTWTTHELHGMATLEQALSFLLVSVLLNKAAEACGPTAANNDDFHTGLCEWADRAAERALERIEKEMFASLPKDPPGGDALYSKFADLGRRVKAVDAALEAEGQPQ